MLFYTDCERTALKMLNPSDLPVFASKTVRIVCISDTHGEDPSARLPPGDIFIHAGDLTDGGSLPELEKAYRWISMLPYRVKVVVAGKTCRCDSSYFPTASHIH